MNDFFQNLFGSQEDDLMKRMMDNGMDEFDAYDAAQLTNAGYGEAAVAQNLGAAGVQDADFAAADAAMGMHDMNSASTDDFNLKGFATDLAKAAKANASEDGFGQSLYNQKIKNIGLLRMPQAPQQPQTPQVQPLQSTAMQAIQGNGPQNPLLDNLLRNLGYGR